MSENFIKSYKGMDNNMRCRGFQYEIGKTYELDTAKCCKSGFHACLVPLDVFSYYAPADSRYFQVEQSGETDHAHDDSKVASSKLTVGAEIGIPGLVKAHVEWLNEHLSKFNKDTNTGDRSAAKVTGNGSVAVAIGLESCASGAIGCAIVLVERGNYDGKTYPIKNIRAVMIDGEHYKPNVWYTLKNGEVVESYNLGNA